MIVGLFARARYRLIVYILVTAVLLIGRFWAVGVSWQASLQFYVLTTLMAAALALFVGILALVRFATRGHNVYFLIGLGFLGAALLDAYRVVGNGGQNEAWGLWGRSAAAIFLSLFMAASWLAWRWPSNGRSRQPIAAALAATALTGLLIWLTWRTPSAPDLIAGRAGAVVAAGFFALGLAGYLVRSAWRRDPFEYWLVMALIFCLVGEAGFAWFAADPFDAMFAAVTLLRLVAYLCVLAGLLVGIITIFQQAEQAVAGLAGVNEALQREIAERKRAETAEYEQRQLAEALREVGIALSATLDFDELLELLLEQIARVIPYDTANVMQVMNDQIHIVCTRGYDQERQPQLPHFAIADLPSLQQMTNSRQPLIIPDTAVDPQWVNPEISPHVRSWAGAPIVIQGEVAAFLALNNSQPGFYRPADAARLAAFASQAAVAMQNARLYEALQKRVEEQITLNMISQAVTSTLDLRETLTIITDHTTRLLRVAATSVVLVDKDQKDLWFAAASGQASDFVRGKRLAPGQGILGWVAQHGQAVLVPDVSQDVRHFTDFDQESGFQARSILCVPLQSKGQTIGAIEALNKEKGPFDADDLRLLTLLAGPAATAIENAQLYQQAQQEITERLRAEQALEAERALLARRVEERTADLSAANAELAQAARLKDEFLASISHELRTPLNAILGISEALQEEVYGPLNEKQVGSLHSIEESGRHLLSLINDILDLSKAEAGKLEMEIRPVDLKSVCLASLRLIKENAFKKQIKIHTVFDDAVTTIQADERRLKQILVNLLGNAVKFTLKGGEMGLEVKADEMKGLVYVSVWDTGIGIVPEDKSRLFRPFVQLDSSLSREYAGTGLGLSLVYRMVELHGGTVSVESEVNKGSRFTVAFPWSGPDNRFNPWLEAEQTAADVPHLSSFQRVMLITDSAATAAQLIRYLGELGVETITHKQAQGTVEKALVVQPDLIILDALLPDATGWQVLAQLQAEPPTREIPVLLTSVAGEQRQAMDLGAAAFLAKPINRLQLQSALRQILIQRIEARWAALVTKT